MVRLRNVFFGNLVFCCLLLVVLLAPQNAHAARLGLGVGPPPPPDTRAAAGTLVNFTGQLSYTSDDAFNIAALDDPTLTADNLEWVFADYDINVLRPSGALSPNFFLRPGESVSGISLYNVFISPSAIPGNYSLSAYLRGSTESTAGIESNVVRVTLEVQAVPEPASMLLLGTGLAGVVAGVRRRKLRR